MPSSKEYMLFVLDQLAGLEEIACKRMMGEYILCYQGKTVGGIYDDRLLIKPTPSAKRLLPDAPAALPYEGAKEMLAVEDPEDRDLLRELIPAVAADLPAPKNKRKT